MNTTSPCPIKVLISEKKLTQILSKMCEDTCRTYDMDHLFRFTGDYTLNKQAVFHPNGIKCFLEPQKLSTATDAPLLGAGSEQIYLDFSEQDLNGALIAFATRERHIPQGVNVNHTCEVQWSQSNDEACVEVLIATSIDDPDDYK